MPEANQAAPNEDQSPENQSPENQPSRARPELLALCIGLEKLTDQELGELDQAITPRIAAIMAKAFGNEFLEILGPFYRNDDKNAAAASTRDGQDNAKSLRQMIADPRYRRERDKNFIGQVEAGFQKLYANPS